MPPSLSQERSARGQHLAQSQSSMLQQQIAQAQQRLARLATSPLQKAMLDLASLFSSLNIAAFNESPLRRYEPHIIALMKSSKQITGVPDRLLGSESQQIKRVQLVLTSIAWIKSISEGSSQNPPPENDFSDLERLVVMFIDHMRFWFDIHQNGEGGAEEYAIENAKHVLNVAQHIKPTNAVQEMISDTYTTYWQTLEKRMRRTKTREDLDATVQALRCSGQFVQSAEATMVCKVTLANLMWTMWRSPGQSDTMFEEAMDSSREVIRGTFWSQARTGELIDRYATMHKHLMDASSNYDTWFTNQEVFSDLDAAVKTAALAYQGLLPGAPENIQETTTRQFGDVSRTRYDWAGSFGDLWQALAAARTSLAKFPCSPGGADFNGTRCAMRLVDISSYHDMKDHLDEARSLLNRSLKFYEGVVEKPTRWEPCERAVCLRFMSVVYRMIWRRRRMNGESRDCLDLSVQCADEAVAMLHEEDPLLSAGVDNHTLAHYTRYLSPYRKPSDLDTAIASATRAVDLGAHNYSNIRRAPRAAERMTVVSIGIAGEVLAARYLRDEHHSDLDAAVYAIKMLLKLLPPMHPERVHALQTYRDLLELKLQRSLKGEDSQRGYNLLKRWFFKVSRSSFSSSRCLAEFDLNLLRSILSLNRGRSGNSPLDAVRRPRMAAVVLGNEPLYRDLSPIVQARGAYPADLRLSMDKPGLCIQGSAAPFLGRGISEIETMFRETRLSDAQKKIATGLKSLLLVELNTAEKVTSMLSFSEWLFQNQEWKGLQAIWRHCFGTLDSLDLHTMRTKEYQSAFRRLAMLAVMVASSMLAQKQDIWSTILVLERGREILNSLSFLSTRSQRIKYSPHLERQVQELVADLKNPGLERNHEHRRSEFRHLEAFERNSRDMLKAVQDVITCERDITPFGKEHIIQQSQAGPIVMLVATTIGAHAIIVTPFKTRAIALDKCSYKEVVEKSRTARLALSQCVEDQSLIGDANRKLRQCLKWLWDTVAHPIVKDLGLIPSDSVDKLPRIQWVCCGIFSRLPVHAAGIFTRPGKPHLAQYAVSSYLSSVRYTIMAKRKDPYLQPTQSQILIVAMPHTEADANARYGDLDTEAESLAIRNNLPQSMNTLNATYPDMGSVESLIGGCRIAHFSCHGIVDSADPLGSRLVIRFDAQRPLTVAAIRDLSSSFSRLAFLSACHSADFEDLSTADEVVHVTKAFQLAGFPSVVGTLWQAFDGDAVLVSEEFYAYIARHLDSGDVKELDGDLFARALHSAVKRLREKNPYSCAGWASWIHYGD